jgi:acyl-[acyl-carrier-protein]-phospholipid O-acyltransferase/long-chain-fatty-acid--[acyl-carrier-protein] ligase
MLKSQFALLRERRFLPLFVTQALGAFNDNLFKNALVILITFRLAALAGVDSGVMVTVAAGIFILPFFLFSATAGQLADHYDKARMIRLVKLVEILLMLAAALGFYLDSLYFLLAVLFLMGSQSAFFGPLKYSILPEHLDDDELIAGNGLIQAATFLAILLGTLVGGLLILSDSGRIGISLMVVTIAAAGWLASREIPVTRVAAPDLRVSLNFLWETWLIVRHAASRREIFLPTLAVSWFWLVGATFLAQMPNLGKLVLRGDEVLVTLLLLAFSVGIGVGSMLCNRLLRGALRTTFVPLGALGITLFSLDLHFSAAAFVAAEQSVTVTLAQFVAEWRGVRVLLDLFMIALAGGVYIVPLNALIQARSNPAHRARNIAALNVLNALFMVVSALASALLLGMGGTVPELFLILALANIGAVLLTARIG